MPGDTVRFQYKNCKEPVTICEFIVLGVCLTKKRKSVVSRETYIDPGKDKKPIKTQVKNQYIFNLCKVSEDRTQCTHVLGYETPNGKFSEFTHHLKLLDIKTGKTVKVRKFCDLINRY